MPIGPAPVPIEFWWLLAVAFGILIVGSQDLVVWAEQSFSKLPRPKFPSPEDEGASLLELGAIWGWWPWVPITHRQ